MEEEEGSVVEHGKGVVSKLIWGDQETSRRNDITTDSSVYK